MFGLVLLTGFTAMHGFLAWRAATLPPLRRGAGRKALVVAALALWALFVAARALRHVDSGAAGAALELAGMSWMGTVFLTSACVLAGELLRLLAGLFLGSAAVVLRWAALAAGLAISAVALVQGTRPPVVESHEVSLPGLPPALDGTVLVAVSDTHLGPVLGGDWLAGLAGQIEAARPDLVVLVGDVFDGHGIRPDELLPALRRLRAPRGVWAVPGNHDLHDGAGAGLPLLAQAGHRVLRNQWAELAPGLVLAGVDDLTTARRRGVTEDLVARTLSGRPPGATVLLSHTPWDVEKAAAGGAGLMLSGHTHGGQLWPVGHLVRGRYPFVEGRFELGAMTLLVSRGAGTWGPRMRLWRPGQILRVTLRSPRADP